MDWEYYCDLCGKFYCTGNPEPRGFTRVCWDCWTPEWKSRMEKFCDEREAAEEQQQYELSAKGKLEKIPKWIRNIFDAT